MAPPVSRHALPASRPRTASNCCAKEKPRKRLELVLTYSPFPASVCGQVCPNLCMDACSRRYLDHPVAMQELGRLSQSVAAPELQPSTGRKVAVLGGGPAGLSVAWQLALRGHSVALYEADKEVGGKLRQAIPAERLPREVLNDEINRIKNIGVDIRTDSKIDKDAFETIQGEFDAVVVATGRSQSGGHPLPRPRTPG